MSSNPRTHLTAMLSSRLSGAPGDNGALDWLHEAAAEVESGAEPKRFASLIALASRKLPRGQLAPTDAERDAAHEACEGWNPERWSLLEAARVVLAIGASKSGGVDAIEEGFRYADVGEQCALYRSLALLSDPAAYEWRAGEGCRSNMRGVFEAVACDTPYPALYFDDLAWRQLAIKAIFVGAPLWRVWGFDNRLSPELARMALDLAEERRSAGRPVQPELWMCLGPHAGERGLAAIEHELTGSNTLGRAGAALALARADEHTGDGGRLAAFCETERDPAVSAIARAALEGQHASTAYRSVSAEAEMYEKDD